MLFNGTRKVVGKPAEYHIVKKLVNSDFETYEIYYDNKPCLLPSKDFCLDKLSAQKIANLLNGIQNVPITSTAHTSRSISNC